MRRTLAPKPVAPFRAKLAERLVVHVVVHVHKLCGVRKVGTHARLFLHSTTRGELGT